MQKLFLVAAYVVILPAAFVVVSCNNNSNSSNPLSSGGQQFAPPTALRALSGNDSLFVVWHPSVDIDSGGFGGYSVMAVDQSGNSVTVTMTLRGVNKSDSTTVISGLTNGVAYTITINSMDTSGTLGAASAALKWAPAQRYYGMKLYSLYASSAYPSGLQLSLVNGVKATSVANNPDSVDLVFDDKNNSFDIVSPSKSSANDTLKRVTKFAGFVGYANGLSDLALADSAVDTLGWQEVGMSLGDNHTGRNANDKGEAFWIYTQDNNFARVFVRADQSGDMISQVTDPQTGNTYNYITVDVSIQSTPGMAYSLAHKSISAKLPN